MSLKSMIKVGGVAVLWSCCSYSLPSARRNGNTGQDLVGRIDHMVGNHRLPAPCEHRPIDHIRYWFSAVSA